MFLWGESPVAVGARERSRARFLPRCTVLVAHRDSCDATEARLAVRTCQAGSVSRGRTGGVLLKHNPAVTPRTAEKALVCRFLCTEPHNPLPGRIVARDVHLNRPTGKRRRGVEKPRLLPRR